MRGAGPDFALRWDSGDEGLARARAAGEMCDGAAPGGGMPLLEAMSLAREGEESRGRDSRRALAIAWLVDLALALDGSA